VECITSAECFAKDQEKPICQADNTCGFCTEDTACLNSLILFETCHIESDSNGEQIIGRCVQDNYNKGFQVAAIVLGSIGVFGVILAIGIGAASYATAAKAS